jgi:hypothetical protein
VGERDFGRVLGEEAGTETFFVGEDGPADLPFKSEGLGVEGDRTENCRGEEEILCEVDFSDGFNGEDLDVCREGISRDGGVALPDGVEGLECEGDSFD